MFGRFTEMVQDIVDARRSEPPMDGLSDREMLEAWLEFHRTTLLLKVEGVDDEARKHAPVATSSLSLHGLVRHMAEVERSWFRRVLQRQPDAPYIWYDPAVEDSDMVPLGSADWAEDLGVGQPGGGASRRAAPPRGLDDGGRTGGGNPSSLGWISAHMIEKSARHN